MLIGSNALPQRMERPEPDGFITTFELPNSIFENGVNKVQVGAEGTTRGSVGGLVVVGGGADQSGSGWGWGWGCGCGTFGSRCGSDWAVKLWKDVIILDKGCGNGGVVGEDCCHQAEFKFGHVFGIIFHI